MSISFYFSYLLYNQDVLFWIFISQFYFFQRMVLSIPRSKFSISLPLPVILMLLTNQLNFILTLISPIGKIRKMHQEVSLFSIRVCYLHQIAFFITFCYPSLSILLSFYSIESFHLSDGLQAFCSIQIMLLTIWWWLYASAYDKIYHLKILWHPRSDSQIFQL